MGSKNSDPNSFPPFLFLPVCGCQPRTGRNRNGSGVALSTTPMDESMGYDCRARCTGARGPVAAPSTVLTGTSYAVYAGHMVYTFCLLSRRCQGRCASTDARQGPSPGPFPRWRNPVSPLPGLLAIIDVDPRLKPWAMISRPLRGGQSGSAPKAALSGARAGRRQVEAVLHKTPSAKNVETPGPALRAVSGTACRAPTCVRMLA